MSNFLELARQIAETAHEGQTDKAGQPYISHPLAVAEKVSGEAEKIVALLHDVVEDSDITIEQLRQYGFSREVVSAVNALTKRPGQQYEQYLQEVKRNKLATNVKKADLLHNMDLSRFDGSVTDADLKRREKYAKALEYLLT